MQMLHHILEVTFMFVFWCFEDPCSYESSAETLMNQQSLGWLHSEPSIHHPNSCPAAFTEK